MRTANDVIADWIQSAEQRRIKIGLKDLTPEECDICAQLLRCVAGDLMLLETPPVEKES